MKGWEANRIAYNEAMSDRHAPASFLIGLGESDSFFIGVQKDQIEMVEEGAQKGRHCLIKLGRPEEHFEIVRESKHVFVLKVQSGYGRFGCQTKNPDKNP